MRWVSEGRRDECWEAKGILGEKDEHEADV